MIEEYLQTTSTPTRAPRVNSAPSKKATITDFLKAISQDIIPEIEFLLDSETTSESKRGNLAIPLALTVFSLIDLLSGLMKKDDGKTEITQTAKLMKQLLQNSELFTYEKNEIGSIAAIYRNGMIHSIYPKNNRGIAKLGKDKPLIIEKKIDGEEIKTLNISNLASRTLEAYDRIQIKVNREADDSPYINVLAKNLCDIQNVENREVDCSCAALPE